MGAPPSLPRSAGPKGVVPDEWPAQAADTIVETIAKVRDKTTKPALKAARGLVYGVVIAVVGTIAIVLLWTLFLRILDNYLPGNVWTIYAVFAVALSVGGLVLLRKANRPKPPETV